MTTLITLPDLGSSAWTQNGWRSTQTLTDGQHVEFTVTDLSSSLIFGCSSETLTPRNYTEIDAGLLWGGANSNYWCNNGLNPDTSFDLAVGNIIRFARSGTSIVVSRGGITLHTFTSLTMPQYAWAISTGSPALTVAIGDINGATPTTGASLNANFGSGDNDFTVDNTKLFFSPYNWRKSGSTYAQSNNPGAYMVIKMTGTDCIIKLDTTINASLSTAIKYPKLCWQVDDGIIYDFQLVAGQIQQRVMSEATDTTHKIKVWFDGVLITEERWTSPPTAVRVTGVRLNTGGTLLDPDLLPCRAILFGDSNTEGNEALGAGVTVANQTAAKAFPQLLLRALNAELGVIGFSGQGYTAGGLGSVPDLIDAWDFYESGQSRLVGGLLDPPPDYVICCHGQNDNLGGVQAEVEAFIAAIRIAAPRAEIAIVSPPNQDEVAAIEAAVVAAEDAYCKFINLEVDYLTNTSNGSHLSLAVTHPIVGASIAGKIQEVFGSPFDYQWKKDGTAIAGQTYRRLKLDKVDSGDDGSYSLVVTNRRTGVSVTVGPESIVVG